MRHAAFNRHSLEINHRAANQIMAKPKSNKRRIINYL